MNGMYIIYKENNKYKLTSYKNYYAIIRNANEITDFSNFENVEQITKYINTYKKYFKDIEFLTYIE